MTNLYQNVVYDTIMFILGIFIGGIMDYNFTSIFVVNNTILHIGIIGILQIVINAMIMQTVMLITQKNVGLFSLGLLTSQKFFIKKLFNYKSKVLEKKEKDNEDNQTE